MVYTHAFTFGALGWGDAESPWVWSWDPDALAIEKGLQKHSKQIPKNRLNNYPSNFLDFFSIKLISCFFFKRKIWLRFDYEPKVGSVGALLSRPRPSTLEFTSHVYSIAAAGALKTQWKYSPCHIHFLFVYILKSLVCLFFLSNSKLPRLGLVHDLPSYRVHVCAP